MELGLSTKIAAITGASEGIGKATALRFLQEGARVAICGRRSDVLERAAAELRAAVAGAQLLALPADVTKPEDVTRFIASIVDRWGGLDILVNNAGTSSAHTFEQADDAIWQADFELKVHAAIRTVRAALPHLRRSAQARVINLTTPGGKHPGPRSLPTSVSRAAGIALTKALSKDLAADGILVNTVCVGVIKSAQQDRMAERLNLALPAYYQEVGRHVPLKRVGEAVEVADAIVFLASSAASYITGASLNVDGGSSGAV